MVAIARRLARKEKLGEVEVNKQSQFDAYRITYRKSTSGYQVVLPNVSLGWEDDWGPSYAENRCPACGWSVGDRVPPRTVSRSCFSRLFSSMDGYLVVWFGIVERFEKEGVSGVRFVPVQDPDVDQLTMCVYSGSFEVSRSRLLDEFPSSIRSSGELSRASSESVRTLMRAVEAALDEQYENRKITELGLPEDRTWIRLPAWMQDDRAVSAFQRFCMRFEERQMMSFGCYPPPPPGRESKWYALLPDEPVVPEHETTTYNKITACPECGLRPALEGPLCLPEPLVEGRDIVETSGNWVVASDRICKILREYDPFAMSPVVLVD